MTQALYRKWRPQVFDQIVGQEHVTQTLRNALALGRVGHAYLFAGLRGTGKTTMARLLAKAVNCLAEDPADRPCNECVVCKAVSEGRFLDLIEIDAASHTGVDDVRELRDKVGFRPNQGCYKVYIIDEVHRFSGSAFDALLKTIEEPPEHAIFILATTEIHKVPATILSRCQRFDFRRIPLQKIVQHLHELVQAEGWSVEPQALTLIARAATGSLRDAISLLDQLAATDMGGVTLAQVQATLGTVDAELVVALVDSLVARDVASGLVLINQALDRGADLRQFTRQIVGHLRAMLLVQLQGAALLDLSSESLELVEKQAEQIGTSALVGAVKRFNQAEVELRGGWQPQLPLELALVEVSIALGGEVVEPSPAATRETSVTYQVKSEPVNAGEEPEPAAAVQSEPESAPQDRQTVVVELAIEFVRQHWPQVLAEMKRRASGVQALLNSAHPVDVQGEVVFLNIDHEFARDQLSRGQTKQLVEEVLSQVVGQNCRVAYKVVDTSGGVLASARQSEPRDAWSDDPLVQVAKQMGAEIRPIS